MTMTKYRRGDRAKCWRCGQEVEFQGNKRWADRGNNTKCGPYNHRAYKPPDLAECQPVIYAVHKLADEYTLEPAGLGDLFLDEKEARAWSRRRANETGVPHIMRILKI